MAHSHPTVDGARFATIDRFPGYAFGDDGSIWSSRVKGHAGVVGPWKRLNPRCAHDGYIKATLIDGKGRRHCCPVHRLILEAFVGPRPEGCPISRHLDGDPFNNRLDNLAWGNHSENFADAARHGTARPSGKPMLAPDVIRAIREEYRSDQRWGRVMRLARKHGVSHTQIKRIVRGQHHANV